MSLDKMIDISGLSEGELRKICPYISNLEPNASNIDYVGFRLSFNLQNEAGVDKHNDSIISEKISIYEARDYWSQVKKEIYLLLCTKDRKYSHLRRQFSRNSSKATTTVVSMVSASFATQMGLVVGIITPLVALLLYAILKIGLNSWCNIQKEIMK